jgi:hypothetical protein
MNFDGAAAAFEHGARLAVIASHDASQSFGIELLAERRWTGDASEHDGDNPPCLSRRFFSTQLCRTEDERASAGSVRRKPHNQPSLKPE